VATSNTTIQPPGSKTAAVARPGLWTLVSRPK